jgi:hypothetical protein
MRSPVSERFTVHTAPASQTPASPRNSLKAPPYSYLQSTRINRYSRFWARLERVKPFFRVAQVAVLWGEPPSAGEGSAEGHRHRGGDRWLGGV